MGGQRPWNGSFRTTPAREPGASSGSWAVRDVGGRDGDLLRRNVAKRRYAIWCLRGVSRAQPSELSPKGVQLNSAGGGRHPSPEPSSSRNPEVGELKRWHC